jgi:hypothetical protein
MSLSPRASFFQRSRKSLNIVENDTPAPDKEADMQNLLRVPSKSFADANHDESKPNKVFQFIRQITNSPTKIKKPHTRNLTAKVTYTKRYEDFAPPENDENIPSYNKDVNMIE